VVSINMVVLVEMEDVQVIVLLKNGVHICRVWITWPAHGQNAYPTL
jgi:hypothetical protein